MMKKVTFNLLVLFLICFSKIVSAQIWAPVGYPGFSGGEAYFTSIAVDDGGVPYVSFSDLLNGRKVTVMKFDGSTWIRLGQDGFSADKVAYTNIAIGVNATPYVVYEEITGKNIFNIIVKKFDGTNWIQVGTALPCDVTGTPTIAINKAGAPYISFYHGQVNVMTYDGKGWQAVGDLSSAVSSRPGLSAAPGLALDVNGNPYVIYANAQNYATVTGFTNKAWDAKGNLGNTFLTMASTIKFDSNNTPFVTVWIGTKLFIGKFVKGNWLSVGKGGIEAAGVPYTSMVIYKGTPYVLSTLSMPGGKFGKTKAVLYTLKNDTWEVVGKGPGFSAGGAYYGQLAITKQGQIYAVYSDVSFSNSVTVMTYK